MLLSRLHHREASAHKRSYDLYVCSDTKLAEEVTASFAHIIQFLLRSANTTACAVVTTVLAQGPAACDTNGLFEAERNARKQNPPMRGQDCQFAAASCSPYCTRETA